MCLSPVPVQNVSLCPAWWLPHPALLGNDPRHLLDTQPLGPSPPRVTSSSPWWVPGFQHTSGLGTILILIHELSLAISVGLPPGNHRPADGHLDCEC